MIPRLARGLAVAIAIAAIVDPAVTVTRRSQPIVSVIAMADGEGPLAARVRAALADDFTVLDAPFGAADATVLVGDGRPASGEALAGAVFTVLPERPGPAVRIESVVAPRRIPLDAKTDIRVAVRARAATGRTLVISLRSGGLEVGRTERVIGSDDERIDGRVAFIPTARGAIPLEVVAVVEGGSEPAAVDALVDVDDRPIELLFHDARPSWMSTFVRRAVERDPRFNTASRTITSPGVGIEAGGPPPLAYPGALSRFDGIVIGAPESLSEGEVVALERYLRERGGAVLLLLDREADGPFRRLAGTDGWTAETIDAGVPVAGPDLPPADPSGPEQREPAARTASLVATEILMPDPLPAGAGGIAGRAGADGTVRPVVWRSAAGAGRVVVSGALDAWRFRDPAQSGFDAFWRSTIARIAAESPARVDVRVEDPVVSPGGTTDVTVTLRDIALPEPAVGDASRASVSAVLEGPGGRWSLRLWPDGPVGRVRARVDAPNEPGAYRVIVSSGAASGDAALLVAPSPSFAAPDERELVAARVRASGGAIFSSASLDRLSHSLMATLEPEPRRVPWRPMRAAWWIVPFVLALGVDWWSRRRRGLA